MGLLDQNIRRLQIADYLCVEKPSLFRKYHHKKVKKIGSYYYQSPKVLNLSLTCSYLV